LTPEASRSAGAETIVVHNVNHRPDHMSQPEVWLRGRLDDIPLLLQPVAHSLLQSREEFTSYLAGLSPDKIWQQQPGSASVGYHVRHAAGSLDRLFTYARGEQLSPEQREALLAESETAEKPGAAKLLAAFNQAIERAIAQLRATAEPTLTSPRFVGRAKLPSTVLGLLFHAAEHTQRHAGQVVTTIKLLTEAAP
jgi:uncharacterized damage-inducible protein DinB